MAAGAAVEAAASEAAGERTDTSRHPTQVNVKTQVPQFCIILIILTVYELLYMFASLLAGQITLYTESSRKVSYWSELLNVFTTYLSEWIKNFEHSGQF